MAIICRARFTGCYARRRSATDTVHISPEGSTTGDIPFGRFPAWIKALYWRIQVLPLPEFGYTLPIRCRVRELPSTTCGLPVSVADEIVCTTSPASSAILNDHSRQQATILIADDAGPVCRKIRCAATDPAPFLPNPTQSPFH